LHMNDLTLCKGSSTVCDRRLKESFRIVLP
jgi:hypothetical protein